jgi:membrane-bound lytic murein transglycosylase B
MAQYLYSVLLTAIFSFVILLFPLQASANWTPLIERLVADNFDEQTVKTLFAQPVVKFDPNIMSCKIREIVRNRSKKPDAVAARKIKAAYARFLQPEAISQAHAYAQRNGIVLQNIRNNFCVPKEIIVSIVLVETELGKNLGTRGAFNTLASMAMSYDLETIRPYLAPDLITERNENLVKKRCRQKANWAYTELKALIRHASERGIDPLSIPGSVYGAIGICQFMPSQIPAYGVDGDRDGYINLFSDEDALFSVAKYLRGHGWKCGMSTKRQHRVILAYNHSKIYASTVLGVAERLKTKDGGK